MSWLRAGPPATRNVVCRGALVGGIKALTIYSTERMKPSKTASNARCGAFQTIGSLQNSQHRRHHAAFDRPGC